MKVRATQDGYYGIKRIKEGEEFELVPVTGVKVVNYNTGAKEPITYSPEQQFSERWMVKIEPKKAASAAKIEVQEARARKPKSRPSDVEIA